MENGEVDAVMGVVQDAVSGEKYGFTEPYVSSSASIFVLRQSFDVTGLEDLEGEDVAVQAETRAQTLLAEQPRIRAIVVRSAEEGVQALLDGQVTALVSDEIVGLRAVQRLGLEDEVKVVGLPAARFNYSLAVPKDDAARLNVLNYALASVQAVGLKQQVDRAWFGAPVGVTGAPTTTSMITYVLLFVVVGLVLGNVIYFSLRMRRRVEEHTAVLEESQYRYRKLVEGTDEAVFSVTGDLGLLEVNSRVEGLTGRSKDDLLTMSLEDLVPPAQRHVVSECVRKAFQEGVATRDDVSLLDRHGDGVPVQLSAHLLTQGGRKIVQCIARDVREQTRMRHQVLRRSKDLSTINLIANMVSHVVDLEEMLKRVLSRVLDLTRTEGGMIFLSGRDGEMVPVVKEGLTQELIKLIESTQGPGKLADEVVKSGSVLVWTPFAQPSLSSEARISETGAGTQVGVPLTSKDRVHGVMVVCGREPRRFTDEDIALLTTVGNQIGVAVENAQLIRQLQRTVSEMTAVRQFNDSVLKGMTNGLVVVDRQAKVRLVNRAGESMLGCIEEEVLERSIDEVLGPGAAMVRGSLERELAYSGEEIAIRRDGGETVPLGMSVSPLRGDGGKVSGAVVMLRDLREAKALEEERRRLDRLALLGEISAVMAHEIRNPLAGMAAGIQHMLTKFEEGDEKHQALERIQREGERVNRIIEDILLISRPPHLNLAPCDISEVVEEVVRQHEESARGQGIEIRKYYASELPPMKGDRLRLHQALSNLLKEVIAAVPSGGELRIAVTGPGRVESVGGDDGEWVEVEIWNSVVAIKEEEIGRIFDPFYTTKARGTGLGLAITRRIINEHGGEIEVESKEGEGTRFIVRLPLARRGER
jgi:PAS domain S-box-containing protein